jgi:hypothetical protein
MTEDTSVDASTTSLLNDVDAQKKVDRYKDIRAGSMFFFD